jgi:3,4-dihydroxy 2-butanone 4-phosphate synthase/GTP cyclohydrolase II
MRFDTIDEAIAEIRAGRMVILVDDEREQEGDLVMAAEKVSPEAINFMAMHGRGLICLSLTPERVAQLDLPLMVRGQPDYTGAAFTVSVEAAEGVTTGISAADRAKTILTAIDPGSGPEDLVRPGHIFPIRAEEQGVLVRAGQTEGSVDLAHLAGLAPAGVICEVLNEDGTMAHVPELFAAAQQFGLRIVALSDLIRYRLRTEHHIKPVEEASLSTPHGTFQAITYESCIDGRQHVLLAMGTFSPAQPALVRVHSQCVVGDVFGSALCRCHAHLEGGLRRVAQEGRGAVLYLQHRARTIRLNPYASELSRNARSRTGSQQGSTHPLDLRDYGVGVQILRHVGIRSVRLITTNPAKAEMLETYGLPVVEQVPPVPTA